MANLSRFHRELFRKLFHLFGLVIVFGYSAVALVFDKQIALLSLTGLLLVLMEIEYVRLEHDIELPLQFGKILRKHERDRVTGAIWLTAASIISFSVFDYGIALLSFFFVIFGDMFASLFGIAFGRRKIFRGKTWVGFFAGLIVNVLCGFFLMPGEPFVYLPMALTASFVEVLTSKLDDNFTVPLFSGFVGFVMVSALRVIGV
jgi:dolichol kinase